MNMVIQFLLHELYPKIYKKYMISSFIYSLAITILNINSNLKNKITVAFFVKIISLFLVLFFSLSKVNAQSQIDFPDADSGQVATDFEALRNKQGTIPPVSQRNNINGSGGARINVTSFELVDFKEYPDQNITLETINAFLESLRVKSLREDEIKETGYTKQEVNEILAFVTTIKRRSSDILLTEDDLADLEDLLYRQQERRGLSIAEITNIAQELTNFYRQQGFFLAKAFIPAQEVDEGIIKLQVLEGRLGEVAVTGNEAYDSPVLEKAVAGLMGKTVTKENVESALYTLNDFPGLNVNGFFSASQNIGETKLTIRVDEEKTWNAFARLDNHGSDLTGKTRLFGIYERFNLTGNADKIRLGLLQSEGPDDATFGLAEYSIPIGDGSNVLQFSTSSNEFTAGGSGVGLEVEGETTLYEAAWSKSYMRSREKNLSSKIAFTYKDTSTQVGQAGGLSTDQRIRGGIASLIFDSLFEEQRVLLQGNLDLRYGRFNTGQQDGQDQEYYILAENFSSLFFIDTPFIDLPSRLVVRSNGQFTEQPLPSVDQFSLGGANAVRAFTVSDFSADSGIYLGLEYYIDLPDSLKIPFFGGEKRSLSQFIQPYFFYDYAYGVRRGFNNVGGNEDSFAELTGYGLGLQFNFDSYLSGRLNLSRQASSRFSEDQTEEPRDRLRIFVDFTFKLD